MGKLPSRRDLLEWTGAAAALPGAVEFFGTWLRAQDGHQHSSAPPEPPLLKDYQPKFFDAGDFAALQAFTEILIPTDETPGAREAHCAAFIDFVLQANPPAMQKQWRDAMSALKEAGFHAADASRRTSVDRRRRDAGAEG